MASTAKGTLSTRLIELVGDLNVDATIKNINRSITEIEKRLGRQDNKVRLYVELFGRVKDIEKDVAEIQRKVDGSSSIKNIKLGVELKETTIQDINEQIAEVQRKVDGAKTANKLKLDVDFDFTGSASKIKEEMREIQAFMQQYGDRMKKMDIIDLSDDVASVQRDAEKMGVSFGKIEGDVRATATQIESKLREITGSSGKFSVDFTQDFKGAIDGAKASLTEADGTIQRFKLSVDEASGRLVEQSRTTKIAGDQHERLSVEMKKVEDAQRKLNDAIAKSPEGTNAELREQAENHLKVAQSMGTQERVTNEGTEATRKLNEVIAKMNANTKRIDLEDKFNKIEKETRELLAQLKDFDGAERHVREFEQSIENMSDISVEEMQKLQQQVKDTVQEFVQAGNRIDAEMSAMQRMEFTSAIDERDINSIRRYIEEIEGGRVATLQLSEANSKLNGTVDRVKVNMQEQGGAVKSFTYDIEKGYGNAERAIRKTSESTKTLSEANQGLGGSFREIIGRVTQYIGAIEVLQAGLRLIRMTIQEIMEIDAQMTELARVADPSINLNVMLESSVESAKELGSSVEEVVGSVADMARTFGEFNEAQIMAVSQTAILMDNVSDLSLEQATETLVGTMKAFNIEAEESIHIVNALNEVNIISLLAS